MRRGRGDAVQAVLAALAEHGPLTRLQLRELTGVGETAIHSMHRGLPKQLYIVRYVRDAPDGRTYPRAVFAVGDRPDARKPRNTPRKQDPRIGSVVGVASIFEVGLSRRQRLAARKTPCSSSPSARP